MSLAILFHFLCVQHVSDINMSIIRSLRLCWWITTSVVLFSVRCVLEIWCGWFWVVFVLQAEAQLYKVSEWKAHLMSLAILFHFLCAQHVSDINISIIRSLRMCWWITTSVFLFSVRCMLEIWCRWFWVVFVLQAEAQLYKVYQHVLVQGVWHTNKQYCDWNVIVQNWFGKSPCQCSTLTING